MSFLAKDVKLPYTMIIMLYAALCGPSLGMSHDPICLAVDLEVKSLRLCDIL